MPTGSGDLFIPVTLTKSYGFKDHEIKELSTVTVDIFACIHFRTFPKMGNFTQIYIRIFDIVASMCVAL